MGDAEVSVPWLAVREMSQSWSITRRIRSGRTHVGRARNHWPSSSCASLLRSTLLRFPARGARPTRQVLMCTTYGCGAGLVHGYPRHSRESARRPPLNLIRTFVGLISTDASGHEMSAAKPVQDNSLASFRALSYAAGKSGLRGSREPRMIRRIGGKVVP